MFLHLPLLDVNISGIQPRIQAEGDPSGPSMMSSSLDYHLAQEDGSGTQGTWTFFILAINRAVDPSVSIVKPSTCKRHDPHHDIFIQRPAVITLAIKATFPTEDVGKENPSHRGDLLYRPAGFL